MNKLNDRHFWTKPEGAVGMLVLGVGIVGLSYGLYTLIPLLTALIGSILTLSLLMVLAGMVSFILLDGKTRTLFNYSFQSIMRGITYMFIKRNPIAILKKHVEDLKLKMLNMSSQIGKLRGQIRSMKGLTMENDKIIKSEMDLMSTLNRDPNNKKLILASRKIARLQESNNKYQILLERMNHLYDLLTGLYKNTEIVLEDTIHSVRLKEEEYKAIKAGHSAMDSARGVLSKGSDSRLHFEEAMEHIADELSSKMGEIDRFMTNSEKVMEELALKNDRDAEQGLLMLETLEKESKIREIEKPGDYSQLLYDLEKRAILEQKRIQD